MRYDETVVAGHPRRREDTTPYPSPDARPEDLERYEALGIHDFSPTRKNIREVGIVQWDREITGMFDPGASRIMRAAYESYAGQITAALRKGLGGEKTTAQDVGGGCAATFRAQ